MIKDADFLEVEAKKNEKKEDKRMMVEVVDSFKEEILKGILYVDKESFPKNWQYEDAEGYYKEILENKENINIILKEGEKIKGYLLAIPYQKAYKELKEDDPKMKENSDGFYIETMGISTDSKGKGMAFVRMIRKLIEEAEKKGTGKFALHARVSNGLSEVIKKLYKDGITETRLIENWKYYNSEEATEYIECLLRKATV